MLAFQEELAKRHRNNVAAMTEELKRSGTWAAARGHDGSLGLCRQLNDPVGNNFLHVAAKNGLRSVVQATLVVIHDDGRNARADSEPPMTRSVSGFEPPMTRSTSGFESSNGLSTDANNGHFTALVNGDSGKDSDQGSDSGSGEGNGPRDERGDHVNTVKAVANLLLRGNPIDIRNKQGVTALTFAASSGNADIVEDMCAAGCQINSAPVMGAALKCRLNCLRVMLHHMERNQDYSGLKVTKDEWVSVLHVILFSLWSNREGRRLSAGRDVLEDTTQQSVDQHELSNRSPCASHFDVLGILMSKLSRKQLLSAENAVKLAQTDHVVAIMLGQLRHTPGFLMHYFAYMGYKDGIEYLLDVSR